MTIAARSGAWLLAMFLGSGCGAAQPDAEGVRAGDAAVDGSSCVEGDVVVLDGGRRVGGRYVTRVVSFTPGEGAGFGADAMPDIVMGPPRGEGDLRGSTDVVSLGAGGSIVVGFDVDIVDGPGDDLTVFENPFTVPGVETRYWEELGEVSVSLDGVSWRTFSCNPSGPRPHPNCAGWNPVYANPRDGLCATDPRVSGGDGFDLAAVGLPRARYVRIRDLRTQGLAVPSTGFDLDAVAVVHAAER